MTANSVNAVIGLSLTALAVVTGIMVNNVRTRRAEGLLIPDYSTLNKQADAADYLQYQGADGQLQLNFPHTWVLTETETSPATPAAGKISSDSAKVDFVLRTAKAGEEVADVVECGMKTTECMEVSVNGHTYRRSVKILNTGSRLIQMGAIRNGRALVITGTVSPGAQQDTDAEIVDRILRSVEF